jgi:DNA-binding GntR family transcriptional regulator
MGRASVTSGVGLEKHAVVNKTTRRGHDADETAASASGIGKATSDGSLSEQAYRAIEELVVTSQLPPGSRVSEKTLSTRLGIGRTPIREALQKLAAEGTVVVLPRAGVLISEVDILDQFKLIEVRRELEKIIAGRAARLATVDERAQFLSLAAMFHEAGEQNDERIFLPADREFNRLSAVASRNKYALTAMAPLQAQTRRFWYLYFRQFGDLPLICQLHADVALAISKGAERNARSASDKLVDYVVKYTQKTLLAGA